MQDAKHGELREEVAGACGGLAQYTRVWTLGGRVLMSDHQAWSVEIQSGDPGFE